MKIIHVLNHFLPKQVAGTEIYTLSLIRELLHTGTENLVIIPNYGSRENADYTFEGVQVLLYAEPSVVDRSLIMGNRKPDGLAAFMTLIRAKQPDIIQFHELAGSNGITLAHVKEVKKAGYKTLMTFHLAGYSCKTGSLMYKEKELCDGIIEEKKCSLCYIHKKGFERLSAPVWTVSELLWKLNFNTSSFNNRIGTSLSFPFLIRKLRSDLMELVDSCDRLVLLTDWYHEILLKNGVPSDKMQIIRQGLPMKVNVDKEPRIFEAYPLRLMFIGRISPFKGLHLLIDALKEIDKEKISLHIYGSSNNNNYELECKINSVVMPNVKWMGKISQEEVIPKMKQYHLLCLPSTFSEMSPLVIQEAFAAGIPVITSNTYGNAEQVRHKENGMLFDFNNAGDLKDKLLELIESPDLLEGFKKNISPPTDFSSVAKEYQDLYHKLIEE